MPAVRLSRYEFAPVERDECARTYLDVPDPLPRQQYGDDKRVLVAEGDTLHRIAWDSYKAMLDRSPDQDVGPSRFFWVVGELNDRVDLEDHARLLDAHGTFFRVPSVATLQGEFLVPPRFYSTSREV